MGNIQGQTLVIGLRHIFHPFNSLNTLYRVAYARLAQRKFRNILRGQCDHCWCGGELLPFKWHQSYGVCAECGSYVNQYPPLPQELKRLYSFDLYWHTRKRLKGYPTIEQRRENDLADGRVNFWLGLIERYGPSTGKVLEVGCAHGVLLAELKARGYKCVGLEPDEQTAEWTRKAIGVDVRVGFFPTDDLPKCDLFLALDVIEHSHKPEMFMKGVEQTLNTGGVAIIQTPIDRYDFQPPFGERFEAAFDDIEHLYLFSDKAMELLVQRSGLKIISMSERQSLHHEVCVFTKC